MKNLILTLFYFQLITQICFAQWYQQNSGTLQNLQAVHFTDANNGWVAGDSGLILHTSNGGSDWIQQVSGIDLRIKDVFFTDANTGWAVAYDYPISVILKTSDSGLNWTILRSDTANCLLAIYFINEITGWVVGGLNGSGITVILKTTDGGTNWSYQTTPLCMVLSDVFFRNANMGYAVGIFQTIGYELRALLITTNGGNTWLEHPTSGNPTGGNQITFSDTGDGIISTQASNVHRTTDGGVNWEEVSIENSSIYDVAFASLDNVYGISVNFLLNLGVIYFSSDKGATWSPQLTYPSRLSSIYFIDSNAGWAVGFNGTILHTTNGGIPVELTSFTVNASGNEVILNWSTATETNNQGFSIERKSGNSEFTEIGFVPGFGTTTEPKSYSYTDSNVLEGRYTYRLKQIDFDGSYEYSAEVEAVVTALLEFTLEQNYPNPFNPSTKINWQSPVGSHQTIKVFDVLGNEIAMLVDEHKPAGSYEVEFNASTLPSGVYFCQLKAGNYIDTKKMILIK